MQYLGIYFRKQIDLPAFAEACFRFTPDLSVRPDGRGLFLETSRCLKLHTPESLMKRLRVLLRNWGLRTEDYVLAQGLSLPEAWVRARWGLEENPPIECVKDWLDPLGEGDEERRRIHALIETLFRLGIRRERDLGKLPSDSAVSRFGEVYERLLRHRDPAGPQIWEKFRPRESLSERHEFPPEGGVEELETLVFVLKQMIDRLGRRLFGRGLALTELCVVLECEHRRNVLTNWAELDLTFAFPQSQTAPLLRVLRERLAREFQSKELLSPVQAVEIQVKGTAPRTNVQRNFLDAREEEVEKWRGFITELGTRLGPDEVFLAELTQSHRPERSYRRVMKDPERLENLSLPYPERPLTLLTPPEPLHRVGRYLLWREKRFTIESFSELEKLSGEWWEKDRGYSRTYFRVKTRENALLWIFRDHTAAEKRLYLHGLYREGLGEGG